MCCAARQPKEPARTQPVQQPTTTSQPVESADEDENEVEDEVEDEVKNVAEGEIVLDLTVPEDMDGTTVKCTLPDGTEVELEIPEGLKPGDEFQAVVHVDDLDQADTGARDLSLIHI